MAPPLAAESGVVFLLQSAATTGSGNILACPPSFIHHNFIIKSAAGVTAGAIILETANQYDYTGVWAPITTVPASPISVPAGGAGGAETLIEYEGRLNFVRARISTTVSGGASPSIDVEYLGGKNY